jgi:hypothetical protein
MSVNYALDTKRESLSPYSRSHIEEICKNVENGSLRPKQAHSYEAIHWIKGAPENYGACIVGFTANYLASIESDADDPAIFPQSAGNDPSPASAGNEPPASKPT